MNHVPTVQEGITAFAPWIEPTDAELAAIEQEMPVIEAEIEWLDVRISCLDHTPNELDTRRVRRAARKALDARRALANQAAVTVTEVGA